MDKIYLLLLLGAPAVLSAQAAPTSYTLNPAGMAFMAIAWVCIITWNVLCFVKILRNK